MRFLWHYLENMSVCRIDHRKMAMVQDESKQVNGMLTQLNDHLISSFICRRLGMIQFVSMIEMSF